MEVKTRKLKTGETAIWYRFRHAGKVYTGTIRNKTLPEARREAAQIRADVQRGKGRTPGKSPTLADFIHNTYLPFAETRKRSFYDDQKICAAIVGHFGNQRLADITPKHVRAFQDARLATKTQHDRQRTNTTVNRELSVLSAVFRLAVEDGLLDVNPCHSVRALRREEGVKRFLSVEEFTRLLEQCQGEREHLRALIVVAVFTGLRQAEQLTLRRRQIDFEHDVIRLERTKTNRARVVPMLPEVRAILAELCQDLAADDWVFQSPHPKRKGERIVDPGRAFTKACELAEVTNLRWHDLRHTFGTWLAMSGVEMPVIQEVMGHTDIRTTTGYVHVAAEQTRAAVEKLVSFQERQKNGKNLLVPQKRKGFDCYQQSKP